MNEWWLVYHHHDNRTFENIKVQRKLKPMTHTPDFSTVTSIFCASVLCRWHQLVWMGWQIVGTSARVIFILLQKIEKMEPGKFQKVVKWLCNMYLGLHRHWWYTNHHNHHHVGVILNGFSQLMLASTIAQQYPWVEKNVMDGCVKSWMLVTW